MKYLKLFFLFIFFILVITIILIKVFGIWILNPDHNIYQIRGIDISHHQGDIEWNKVKNSKIDFIHIKATEGGDFVDKKYAENIRNINKIQIPVGVYHFFTLCTRGEVQAENFTSHIEKEKVQLAPVVDLEFPGNCRKRPSKDEFVIELKKFLEIVEKYFGRPVIFYTNDEFYKVYLQEDFQNTLYWYRNIFGDTKSFKSKSIIWQYSEFGRVAGIKTPVDLNAVKLEDWNLILQIPKSNYP
jgi:lysozyme